MRGTDADSATSPSREKQTLTSRHFASSLEWTRQQAVSRLLRFVPLAAIVLLGIVVRVAYLGEPQLFRDEAASWYLASQPLGGLLGQSSHETFPPLYVLLLKGWMAAFGDSEAALRSLSVVAGIGTVLVTWRWARDALGNAGALAAASLVALSPALVLNSRDARMYSLETLFSTSAWWLLWLLIADGRAWSDRQRLGAALGLVLAVAGEVWTMSLGIPIVGLQLAIAVIGFVWLRDRVAALATGCVLFGAATLAPWLPSLLSVATNGQTFWTPRPDLESIAATLRGWLPGDLGGLSTLVVVSACLGALIGLAGAAFGLHKKQPGETVAPGTINWGLRRGRLLALAIAFGFGLVPVVWTYSQLHSIYDPHYLGAAFPPVAIAIASAVAAAARYLRPRLGFAGLVPHGLLEILLVLPILAAMAVGTSRGVEASRGAAAVEPGRQMAQELAALAQPGDVVITLNAQTYFPLEYYLSGRGEAQRLGVGLYDWHRPTAAYFTGWQDIDDSSIVDEAKVARLGWEGAVHLAPGRSLWLVTLVNPGYEFPLFTPLTSGQLREIRRIAVYGGRPTAEIREAIPSGTRLSG